jgi:hypothetical protein
MKGNKRLTAAQMRAGRKMADTLRPYIGDMPVMAVVDNPDYWDPVFLNDGYACVNSLAFMLDRLMLSRSQLDSNGRRGIPPPPENLVDELSDLKGMREAWRRLPESRDVTPRAWRLARL